MQLVKCLKILKDTRRLGISTRLYMFEQPTGKDADNGADTIQISSFYKTIGNLQIFLNEQKCYPKNLATYSQTFI